MTAITDEFMKQMMTTTKNYTIMILKAGPNVSMPGADKIIWEHGRRNFSLREQGILSIVCPVLNSSIVKGIGIFNAGPDEVREVMNQDPGVMQGVFIYEIYACRSFPGDSLPH